MLSLENEIRDFIKAEWEMTVTEIVCFAGYCDIKAFDSLGSYRFIAELSEDNKGLRDIWML